VTRLFASIDEVRATDGEELGPSEPTAINQDRIKLFADADGAPKPAGIAETLLVAVH
jgi:hypothetical protein